MTTNRPLDCVEMRILEVPTDIGPNYVRDKLEILNLGTVAHVIDRTSTENADGSYTVYFMKWCAHGEGARIRQDLQGGKDSTVYDADQASLWTVTCPSCIGRTQKASKRAKPIVLKCPYPRSIIV